MSSNAPHPSVTQSQQYADEQYARDLQTQYDVEHVGTQQSQLQHESTQSFAQTSQPSSYAQEAAQQASLGQSAQYQQQYLSPQSYTTQESPEYNPPLPPRRSQDFQLDEQSGIEYTRDPHKMVAYLVPFPKPRIDHVDPSRIPSRFLIYTPPAPPLQAPAEGEKESKFLKVQRKWQEEVKAAKLSNAKVTSWKGAKGRATKGISAAMNWTKSSNLDFLNRVPNGPSSNDKDHHADDGVHEGDTTSRTVGLTEMLLIYPTTMRGSPEQIRASFVDTMLRTKSQAQRDAILATGLLPVAFAVDICATLIWPFGGLAEIDGVWAFASINGAKTARSITKRLNSSAVEGDAQMADEKQKLALNFVASERLEVLRLYLAAECHARQPEMFEREGSSPTESDVLNAIGWTPSAQGGETKNWEDEEWERRDVSDDVRQVMKKSAKEWEKWCQLFAKDPEKAMKK